MHVIKIHGTKMAETDGFSYVSSNKKGPIGPLCRMMIDHGDRPDDMCEVYRGDALVFHAAPLSHYAEYDVPESDSTGLHRKTYVEFTGF